jgi:hypothetical protein
MVSTDMLLQRRRARRDGKTFRSKGIILVSDPYGKNTEPVQK